MGKLQNNQKGFSAVETVLILVIVAAIGLVGWFVWHSKQTADKNLTPTSSSTPVFKKKAKTTTTPATPSSPKAPQKFLTINEWGVKIPYSSNDTLSYTLAPGGNLVEIISKNLADNYACNTYGAGLIARQNSNDIVPPGPSTVAQTAKTDPSDYKYVGGYYYSFGHDQAACGNITAGPIGQPPSAGESAQTAANNFTKSLIPSVEAK